MKLFLVALIAAASHLVVYAQEAPKTITIQVGNPTAPTQPEKLQFNPRVVAVNPGDTVVYTSNGVHRVREQANFTLCSPLAGSTFDSGPLVRGSTWTVPPQLLVPGKTIIYYCPEGNGTHCASPNNMQGALVVRGLAGGAAGGAAGAAPTGAAPAGGAGAGPKTITVEVGKGGTKFVPDNVSASPGDTVLFTWVGGNHNVVPSDAPASCVKSATADSDPLMQALASGAPKTTGQHSFLVPATAQVGQTLNYYCGVATHCSAGKMYASINIVAAGTAPSATGAAGGSPTAAGGAAGGVAPGADGTDPAAAPAADPAAASASTLTVSTLALTFAVAVSSLM